MDFFSSLLFNTSKMNRKFKLHQTQKEKCLSKKRTCVCGYVRIRMNLLAPLRTNPSNYCAFSPVRSLPGVIFDSVPYRRRTFGRIDSDSTVTEIKILQIHLEVSSSADDLSFSFGGRNFSLFNSRQFIFPFRPSLTISFYRLD